MLFVETTSIYLQLRNEEVLANRELSRTLHIVNARKHNIQVTLQYARETTQHRIKVLAMAIRAESLTERGMTAYNNVIQASEHLSRVILSTHSQEEVAGSRALSRLQEMMKKTM